MTTAPTILYYGRDQPLPTVVPLRAGPLTLVFEAGALRTIRLGEREIVRRLYVAVRDRNWDTIIPTLHDLSIEQTPTTFAIRFVGHHQHDEIDFAWQGTITGDEQGTLHVTMDGRANTTFWRNRIGFCLLHPPRECAGQPFIGVTADGQIEHGHFPVMIAPHQPVKELRAISHPVLPTLWAELAFSGDIFEMEDQRNWTDASYKTYCTPLRLPFPVQITAGSTVQQSVQLTLHGQLPPPTVAPAALQLTLGALGPYRLPTIGLGQASHGQPLTSREVDHLRPLRPAHLRVDLQLDQPTYPAVLAQATATASALETALEVALFLTDNAVGELSDLLQHLISQRPPIARWLIFHRDQKSTGAEWVRLARQRLSDYDPAIPLGAGTNAYFTELNRQRPPVELIDCVVYSINPQVHAFDNLSLVENLAGQAQTVTSARAFSQDLPLIISPVTLRPRFNPNATAAAPAPTDALPPTVDERQLSLFGAGWTLGSLKYLAESGVASITYYETTGWQGVMERASGSPQPARFPSQPGAVFPLYHVLADVAAYGGATVVPLHSAEPLLVDGLALSAGGRMLVLLANLSPHQQTLTLRGLRGAVRQRLLDETTVALASSEPAHFRAATGHRLDPVDGALTLSLRPYAVARLESDEEESHAG